MRTAKGGWEGEVIREGCAWWTRLDDRWLVEVQYVEDGTASVDGATGLAIVNGVLCIFDREDALSLRHEEPTTMIEGARFGPDIRDVERWEAAVLKVIDA